MSQHQITIHYQIVTVEALTDVQRSLSDHCIQRLPNAYAPYSRFQVSASLLLDDGSMLNGVNIENAAYPACICAERTAISTLRTQYPDRKIKTICIAVHSENDAGAGGIAAPCGECRQVIYEIVRHYDYPVSLMLYNNDQQIVLMPDAIDLLPFAFGPEQLNEK